MNFEHRAFLGDAEYTFKLSQPLILELERNTGSAFGALADRVFKRQFSFNDLSETIRLGLVGAGVSPKRAGELVATYVADRPISETYPIARGILLARWIGSEEKEEAK